MVPDQAVAAEINAAAHLIRQCHATSGAYLANCFVRHLGNCIVPAACNMDDLGAAMEVIDALDLRHTRRFMLDHCIMLAGAFTRPLLSLT